MIEKKYNSRTGQPLLTAVKWLFFAIHHSEKEACRRSYIFILLKESMLGSWILNSNSFKIYRNMIEEWKDFLLLLRCKFLMSQYMGSLKLSQGKKLTNQLPWLWGWKRISTSRIEAPKMEWLILYKKLGRQEKSRAEPNRKVCLGVNLRALLQHLSCPSISPRSFLWPAETHRNSWQITHSMLAPHLTGRHIILKLYPNIYHLHFTII